MPPDEHRQPRRKTAAIAPLRAQKDPSFTERSTWKSLQFHFEHNRKLKFRHLFADDPERGNRFSVEAAGIYLDYWKNLITAETIRLLLKLAQECGLYKRINSMFDGEK